MIHLFGLMIIKVDWYTIVSEFNFLLVSYIPGLVPWLGKNV